MGEGEESPSSSQGRNLFSVSPDHPPSSAGRSTQNLNTGGERETDMSHPHKNMVFSRQMCIGKLRLQPWTPWREDPWVSIRSQISNKKKKKDKKRLHSHQATQGPCLNVTL